MSTHHPPPPYTKEQLATLYPSTLDLQLVQVLLRHGERTPVNARFANAGLVAFWPYCNVVRQLRSAVFDSEYSSTPPGGPNTFTSLEWKRRLETFAAKDDSPVVATGPAGELDAVCDMGALTDLGRQTTLNLGQRLRHLYVDQLGFLPRSIQNADSLYLRATPIPRALDSLQQAFQGLYPPSSRAPNFPPPTILTRTPGDETLFPNDGNCRRLAVLARAFAQRTADRWNDSDDLKYVTKKIGKWMPDEAPVAVDGRPRLSGVMDSINATHAHGPATRLPSEFYDERSRAIIDKIGVEEWYSGYKESREYRTLGIGGLMGDIVARMVGSAERSGADGSYEVASAPIRFGLSGCHDTTLAGVLSSLGAFEGEKWPPFTSHVAIELFKQKASPESYSTTAVPEAQPKASGSWLGSWGGSKGRAGVPPAGIGRRTTEELSEEEKKTLQGYFVRIRYNDRIMTVPGCKAVGKHLEGDESFCTLVSWSHFPPLFTKRKDFTTTCANGRALFFV